MPQLAVPSVDSKAPLWEALKVLVHAAVDVGQVFRVYAGGDELADEVPSQVGLVRVETVLYLDSDVRPFTAVRLPSGEWESRPGW